MLVTMVAGCASQTGRPSHGLDPFCAAVGGVLGGGTAAIISVAAGPIGAGVGVGALLGALACRERDPVETTDTSTTSNNNTRVAAVPVAPAPMMAPELDSDGDGVIDRLDRCPNTPPGTKVDVNGCPDLLLSLTGINFKFDSSVIQPNSSDILDHAVASLNESKDVAVRIEGHCDSTGTEAYNQLLSERRANAVKDYLVAHGIVAERLSVLGKGEGTPVASNDSDEGRFQNRRVEFHVAGEAAAAPTAGTESWKTMDQPVSAH
jgi:OOP family OmpA-OmpF porin